MIDLRSLKNDELRDIAREYCITGAWKMNKDTLIDTIIRNAELNKHFDKFYDSENAPEQTQDAPELTEEAEADSLPSEKEEAVERPVEPSNNGWEEIAKKNIKFAYDWITGENENTLQDYEEDSDEYKASYNYLHSGNEIMNDIYHEAITTEYGEGYSGGPAPTEMRFAGKEFCKAYIKELLKKDGYLNESLKGYGAWVVDRETKELTTVVGEAESREAFYQSIKGQYRVRLITKPEKLEEECKQWEIRHARNLKIKQEKYAANKEKAKEMNMSVAEYKKWVKEHE